MRIIHLTFILTIVSILRSYAQKDCVLRRNQDSVFVYTCSSHDSNLKSIRANFTLHAKLSELCPQILNVENYIEWQYKLIKVEILKKIGPNELIYYSQIDAPWPAADRDMVIHLKISQDPKTKVVTMETNAEPEFIPVREGFVRIRLLKGAWKVVPSGENKIDIDYSFKFSPGGSVPAWLVNLSIAEGPHETFKNLKKKIMRKEKVIPLPFIVD